MKKLLSINEIVNSKWPNLFQDIFKENLISAFIHGECLMDGFSALNFPWTISFILKDNHPSIIENLKPYCADAERENIEFCFFFTPADIVNNLHYFPLEFLHIANKNVSLCGLQPLAGFVPETNCLRMECEKELNGFIIHLRRELLFAKNEKKQKKIIENKLTSLLPILYGVFFCQLERYPQNLNQVKEQFDDLFSAKNFCELFNSITKIANLLKN